MGVDMADAVGVEPRNEKAPVKKGNNIMNGSSKTALVEVAELFLFYFRRDQAFFDALQDPRAREISTKEAQPRGSEGEVDPEQAWGVRGMGSLSLASMHYWRHNIDFDYLDRS